MMAGIAGILRAGQKGGCEFHFMQEMCSPTMATSNEAGNLSLAFSGAFYNRTELRTELVARSHILETDSDAEVLIHAYEEWGIDLLQRLNGIFAFALWDGNRKKLFLARDRLGVKPLYYSPSAGRVAFASEMKALLALAEIPREIDREAVAHYLTLGYVPEPHTLFLHVRKLPPGTYLECCLQQVREHRYWQVPNATAWPKSLPDACEHLRWLIQDATRLQLRDGGGLFYSGGIGSTLILWAAARQQLPLEIFFADVENLSTDAPYARLAASLLRMPLRAHHCSCDENAGSLSELLWHIDEPFANPAVLPCYLLARKAAHEVESVLAGSGGDELFGAYPRYHNVGGFLLRNWSSAVRWMAGSRRDMASRFGGLLSYQQRHARRLTIFDEHEVRASLGLNGSGTVAQRMQQLFSECADGDAESSLLFVDINLYLPGLLTMLDKLTTAASLQVHLPLLDHRLVEFAATLPGELRVREHSPARVLRQAFQGEIPEAILKRPKEEFAPPMGEWVRRMVGPRGWELLRARDARILNLLPRSQVARWLSSKGQTNATCARRLWTLFVLELWWRAALEGAGSAQQVKAEMLEAAGGTRSV